MTENEKQATLEVSKFMLEQESTISRLESMNRLYKLQRDEVVDCYNELRQAYFDATGIQFVPRSTIISRVAPTDEDKAWLHSIGINI